MTSINNTHVMLERSVLQGLRDKIEELEETIEMFRFQDGIEPPTICEMTPTQKILFKCLVLDNVVTRQRIYFTLFVGRESDQIPGPKIIDVYISKVRDQLRKHKAEFWIQTEWGRGYILRSGQEPPKMRSPNGRYKMKRRGQI